MERSDFAAFFAKVNEGRKPFRWQERLLDAIVESGRWPDQIAAPTGAGKTSAIDVHVFAVALTAQSGPRLPRRLVMTVGRRVLVDDQYERARALSAMLAKPCDDLIADVAARLARLRWPGGCEDADKRGGLSPLVTGRLRGGMIPSRSWADHPTSCAVLCATPDMWGSRLLFGGYGTSRMATPREAGLLAFDSAVMVDEAHLSRQLVCTVRRVARLAVLADRPLAGVPPLQVTEATATPDGPTGLSVAVEERDLELNHLLAARLTRPKPVQLLPVRGWPAAGKPGKVGNAISAAAAEMAARVSAGQDVPRTVGCFLNTVQMAVAVSDHLRAQDLRVVLVCGQVRPADLGRLQARYPGLLMPSGSAEVDVIVATQSLEVGVDLDLAGIVTELAAGSALAQRAGRVNRRGLREQGSVTVVVPEGEVGDKAQSGPYGPDELRDALSWLRGLETDKAGLAPWWLRENPPPAAAGRRKLYQRPEIADAWHWARTSDDLAADPELDLWLAESLEAETNSVGIVVRDAVPADPAEAVELARAVPPLPWEVFPVPYRTAQAVLTELLDRAGGPATSGGQKLPSMVRIQGDEITPLAARVRADGTNAAAIRPGDLVMVDSSERICTPPPPDASFSPPVIVAATADDGDSLVLADRAAADDVLHSPVEFRDGDLVLRIEARQDREKIAGISRAAAAAILAQAADLQELGERDRRRLLATALSELTEVSVKDKAAGDFLARCADLLRRPVASSEVAVQQVDERIRIVVSDKRRAFADEDVRQVFSLSKEPVTLESHQQAVAGRAGVLASQADLESSLAAALVLAGMHHDDGKQDQRFQSVRLGAVDEAVPLAKSHPGSTVRQVRERDAQGGLPSGWRHEQRSVADCWDEIHAQKEADPLLVARLVGTSHGRGRSGFPHASAELMLPAEDRTPLERAAMLFDLGAWDELIEITQIRYGVWGCAYLEALLRAADCQISGEGR